MFDFTILKDFPNLTTILDVPFMIKHGFLIKKQDNILGFENNIKTRFAQKIFFETLERNKNLRISFLEEELEKSIELTKYPFLKQKTQFELTDFSIEEYNNFLPIKNKIKNSILVKIEFLKKDLNDYDDYNYTNKNYICFINQLNDCISELDLKYPEIPNIIKTISDVITINFPNKITNILMNTYLSDFIIKHDDYFNSVKISLEKLDKFYRFYGKQLKFSNFCNPILEFENKLTPYFYDVSNMLWDLLTPELSSFTRNLILSSFDFTNTKINSLNDELNKLAENVFENFESIDKTFDKFEGKFDCISSILNGLVDDAKVYRKPYPKRDYKRESQLSMLKESICSAKKFVKEKKQRETESYQAQLVSHLYQNRKGLDLLISTSGGHS